MRKINLEFKNAFDGLCKQLRSDNYRLETKCYKHKQNRSIAVIERQDKVRFVELRYHGNQVALYDARTNVLFLDSCSYGTSPTTKELLNTFCPQGFGFCSRSFKPCILTPQGIYEGGQLNLNNYLKD